MLRRYAADATIVNAEADVSNFNEGSLTQCNFSEKLRVLTLRFGGIHTEQMLRGLLVEGINFWIHCIIRRWGTDSREANLDDLAQQTQFLLDLQGENGKAAERDFQWTEFVRRSTESFK